MEFLFSFQKGLNIAILDAWKIMESHDVQYLGFRVRTLNFCDFYVVWIFLDAPPTPDMKLCRNHTYRDQSRTRKLCTSFPNHSLPYPVSLEHLFSVLTKYPCHNIFFVKNVKRVPNGLTNYCVRLWLDSRLRRSRAAPILTNWTANPGVVQRVTWSSWTA